MDYKKAIGKRDLRVKVIDKIEDFLDNSFTEETTNARLKVELSTAIKKKDEIESIFEEIEDNVPDNEREQETEIFENALHHASLIVARLEEIIEKRNSETNGQDGGSVTGESQSRTRLPTLSLPTFSGDIKEYLGFMQRFESVHMREDISDADKFSYLLSLMKGDAEKVLCGLTVNAANYSIALELLEKEFGSQKMTIWAYVKELIKIKKPTAMAQELKDFSLKITKIVRQLEALKFNCKTPEVDLIMVILLLEKMPESIMSRLVALKGEEIYDIDVANLQEMLKRIGTELEASNKPPNMVTRNIMRNVEMNNKGIVSTAAATGIISNGGHPQYKKNTPYCNLCSEEHWYWRCRKYVTPDEKYSRAKDLKLCAKCYKSGHIKKYCSELVCGNCHIRGHSTNDCRRPRSINQNEADVKTVATITSEAARRSIALPTALVSVKSKHGLIKVRVLLDQGSQRSFVTENIAKKCGLKMKNKETLTIDGFSRKGEEACYDVAMINMINDNETICFDAVVIKELPDRIMAKGLKEFSQRLIKKGINLADENPQDEVSIDVLIGADHLHKFISHRKIDGVSIIDTVFGPVVAGPLPYEANSCATTNVVTALKIGVDSIPGDIDFLWKLDNLGIQEIEPHPDDGKAVENFGRNVRKLDGEYEVALPWKRDPSVLPTNFMIAKSRVLNTISRLKVKDPDKLKIYDKIIKEQENEKIIERVVDSENSGNAHFLVHHGVAKESPTTPLRIVFDCSLRGALGEPSLNDLLYSGPNLLPELPQILMRFRMNKIAIIADIRKAFLNVGLREEDRDFVRFLWVEDPLSEDSRLVTYRYRKVLFGSAASQFLLNAVVKHHLENCNNKNTAEKILKNIYVDNILATGDNQGSIIDFFKESVSIMQDAGLPLVAWCCNDKGIKEIIPEEISENRTEISVLGIKWNAQNDNIRIAASNIKNERPTKRNVLSGLSSQFDPLGLIAPTLLKSKLFMRELWKKNMDWDQKLAPQDAQQWQALLLEYDQLTDIIIPRTIISTGEISLHCFSDASSIAMGAVVYVVQGGNSQLTFAKSKLAPGRDLTIPKLELTAILLAAKILKYVREALEKDGCKIVSNNIHTDSQVAKGWVQSKKQLAAYEQRRVDEIKGVADGAKLHYVSTKENPADLLTRGSSPNQIKDNKLWWHGPPKIVGNIDATEGFLLQKDNISAVRMKTIVMPITIPNSQEKIHETILSRCSTLDKAIKVLAYIYRFIKKRRQSRPIGNEEKIEARSKLINMIQNDAFQKEIEYVKRKRGTVPSLVKEFNLDLDNEILVCTSRLQNAEVAQSVKQPILLPNDNRFTRLLIEEMHRDVCHGGVSATLTALRQKYHIIRGRQKVRSVLRTCVTCKREHGRSYPIPNMPPLPSHRVGACRAFENTGVDLAGPFYVREKGVKENSKRYVVLFTCASSRAVHLELVQNLSAESFLEAFTRFSSRRGYPKAMYSDNATNFVKASSMLNERESKHLHEEVIKQLRCNWKFIPSRSPTHGAYWERLIGILKSSLRKSLGKALVSENELYTMLCKIEAVMNDRPLTYVSGDLNDEIPLTPSMLIAGFRLTNIPEDLSDQDNYEPENSIAETLRKRHKHIKKMLDDFWNRYLKEYLPTLKTEKKMPNPSNVPKVGDLVLIAEGEKRFQWPSGRILELLPGQDNQVRIVKVKTRSGVWTRPISKLYPLESLALNESNPEDNDEIQTSLNVNQEGPRSDLTNGLNIEDGNNSTDKENLTKHSRGKRSAAITANERILAISGWGDNVEY